MKKLIALLIFYSIPVLAATSSTIKNTATVIQISKVEPAGIYSLNKQTYLFTNTPLTPFVVKINYTNKSPVTVSKFTIHGPVTNGWYIDTINTTCPYNNPNGILASNATCIVSVAAIDRNSYLANNSPYNYAGKLNLSFPVFSYVDSVGVHHESPIYQSNSMLNVTAKLFANISVKTLVLGSFSQGYTIMATFTLTGTTPNYPITITANLPTTSSNSSIYANNNTCQIYYANNNCSISIKTDTYVPQQQYNYSYIISPPNTTQGITQRLSFKLE